MAIASDIAPSRFAERLFLTLHAQNVPCLLLDDSTVLNEGAAVLQALADKVRACVPTGHRSATARLGVVSGPRRAALARIASSSARLRALRASFALGAEMGAWSPEGSALVSFTHLHTHSLTHSLTPLSTPVYPPRRPPSPS